LFRARFVDSHFDESIFPTLGGEEKQLSKEMNWREISLSYLDSRTSQCELEVQNIICLQALTNQLPDAFTDLNRVTKSHVPAANAPCRIQVPEGQLKIANESKPTLKRGRPIGSKDKNPRKRKGACNGQNEDSLALNESIDMTNIPAENQVPENIENIENEEISTNYIMSGIRWNRNKIDVDDKFANHVALNVINDDEDLEPKSLKECRQRNDWPKWKDAIEAELNPSRKEKFLDLLSEPLMT
jgi:hypothetical protein